MKTPNFEQDNFVCRGGEAVQKVGEGRLGGGGGRGVGMNGGGRCV